MDERHQSHLNISHGFPQTKVHHQSGYHTRRLSHCSRRQFYRRAQQTYVTPPQQKNLQTIGAHRNHPQARLDADASKIPIREPPPITPPPPSQKRKVHIPVGLTVPRKATNPHLLFQPPNPVPLATPVISPTVTPPRVIPPPRVEPPKVVPPPRVVPPPKLSHP